MHQMGQFFLETINVLVGGRQAIEYLMQAKNEFKTESANSELLGQELTRLEQITKSDTTPSALHRLTETYTEFSRVTCRVEHQACALNKILGDIKDEFDYFEKVFKLM